MNINEIYKAELDLVKFDVEQYRRKLLAQDLYSKRPISHKVRMTVLQRDNYKCVLCDSKKNIQVHHKNYNNIGNEKATDLITLCYNCHLKYHNPS